MKSCWEGNKKDKEDGEEAAKWGMGGEKGHTEGGETDPRKLQTYG